MVNSLPGRGPRLLGLVILYSPSYFFEGDDNGDEQFVFLLQRMYGM